MCDSVAVFSLDAIAHFQIKLRFYTYWPCARKLHVSVNFCDCCIVVNINQYIDMVCFNYSIDA